MEKTLSPEMIESKRKKYEEYRRKQREYQKKKYREDPEFRRRCLESQKKYYQERGKKLAEKRKVEKLFGLNPPKLLKCVCPECSSEIVIRISGCDSDSER